MDVIKKDATIVATGSETDMPGTFQVILSAPTKDRDGDTLLPDDWKLPLPDHITFDMDHGMSVASTVGSGTPSIDPATGNLIVDGTFSSLPRAQEVRSLVNEGHIRTTSVAFMSEKQVKDGVSVTKRELLNGAFVAIPSNREALVLSSKALKSGARNNASDAGHIQAIHDHALALGADPKGAPAAPPKKSLNVKDADSDPDADPTAMIAGIDAALDEAQDVFSSYDLTTLPDDIQQAIALVQAAGATVDELMDVVGIPDPDEDATDSAAGTVTAAAADAAAAVTKTAAVEDADSNAVTAKEIEEAALRIQAMQFIN
jgi:hypothetical protein